MARHDLEGLLVFMGGVNGSGKSTIASEVGKRPDVTVFHASKMYREHSKMPSEKLDGLSDEGDNDLRLAFWLSNPFSFRGDFGLIESHYVKTMSDGRLHACINPKIAGGIGLFINLVAEPKVILDRIMNAYDGREGHIIEGILGEHLIRKYGRESEINFMHTATGKEVDFIYKDIGIEVKYGNGDYRDLKMDKGYVLTKSSPPAFENGKAIIPISIFLYLLL